MRQLFGVWRGHGPRFWTRSAVPGLVLLASVLYVAFRVEVPGAAEIAASLSSIPPGAWLGALAASAMSFLAIAQYDVLFHSWLGTGVDKRRAAISGAAGIAISQTLGFGLATGTLARWRALTGTSLKTAVQVTGYVSFSFMAALGVLTAVAITWSSEPMPGAEVFATSAIAAVLLAMALSLILPRWLPFDVPPIPVILRLLVLAGIDTGCAALALWMLLPGITTPDLMTVFSAYLLATAAGLLSGTPAGAGPFEICLLTLLTTIPEPELLAHIMAFRLVYYVLPACLGVLVLARPPSPKRLQGHGTGDAARHGPVRRAEAGLARLPRHRLMPLGRGTVVLAEASQFRIAIGDPVDTGRLSADDAVALAAAARDRGVWPAAYKIGTRSAACLRAAGWSLAHVSDEAWIDPRTFTLEGTERRQLRRKLRQAERSGVVTKRVDEIEAAQMARVAADWAARCGGERGFSMGTYDDGYVAFQRVYAAWRAEKLVAFITCHTTGRECALDLMRSASDAPSGTMHALVSAAIEDTARHGFTHFSLAAMARDMPPWWLRPLTARPEARGLGQFKSAFAPRRRRLYLAAPNRLLWWLAACDILLRIAKPDKIKQ